MYKYIQAKIASLATPFQAKGRSDIERLNCSDVAAFFVSVEKLFHKVDALYLKLRLRKLVLRFGNFKSVSESRKS